MVTTRALSRRRECRRRSSSRACRACSIPHCSTRSTVGAELSSRFMPPHCHRDKKETPPTFKALSLRFKDRMRLGQASHP